jgi:hypothetical protein
MNHFYREDAKTQSKAPWHFLLFDLFVSLSSWRLPQHCFIGNGAALGRGGEICFSDVQK